MKRHIALAVASIAVAAGLPFAYAQDMAVTAGNKAKVILDNDKVRVFELEVPPGGSTGMHSHGDNIVYWLTASDGVQSMADGKKVDMHRTAGEIKWSGPVVHDTLNTGKNTTKVLVIELKEAGATSASK